VGGVDRATFSTKALSVGSHTLSAAYNGSNNFLGSSASATQIVNKDGTSTAVTSSLNPSVVRQPVTFTATVHAVAPGSGIASGTVTFKDGSNALGTGALNSGGQATFSTSSLTVSTHTITAAYGGNSSFMASTSAALVQTVKVSVAAVAGNPSAANPLAILANSSTQAAIPKASPAALVPVAAKPEETNLLPASRIDSYFASISTHRRTRTLAGALSRVHQDEDWLGT
jgi:hypothetical protein